MAISCLNSKPWHNQSPAPCFISASSQRTFSALEAPGWWVSSVCPGCSQCCLTCFRGSQPPFFCLERREELGAVSSCAPLLCFAHSFICLQHCCPPLYGEWWWQQWCPSFSGSPLIPCKAWFPLMDLSFRQLILADRQAESPSFWWVGTWAQRQNHCGRWDRLDSLLYSSCCLREGINFRIWYKVL